MTRFRLVSFLLVALGAAALEASPGTDENVNLDLIAVPPPEALLVGRIMMKDGVTPVPGAELVLTGGIDDTPHVARADRRGRFRLKLEVGEYRLRVSRRTDVYQSAASYRVPARGRIEIDFLLLPDFEPGPESSPAAGKAGDPAARGRANGVSGRDPQPGARRGPDPVAETPQVVGSVVDVLRAPAEGGRARRWAETLGFLGSLLAVMLLAR